MRHYDVFFARGGLASLVILAGGAGIVLVLSMPWAGTVGDFFRFPWRPTPVAVLIAVSFFASLHALNRGGTVELLPHLQRRQLLSLPLQVVCAQLLVVPYFVACAALTTPSHVATLWEVWAYIGVVDLALSFAAFHVARQCGRRAVGAFFPLLGLAATAFGLPLAVGLPVVSLRAVALLSPPYAVFSLLSTGLRGTGVCLAFAVPAGAAAWLCLSGLRQTSRSIHERLP